MKIEGLVIDGERVFISVEDMAEALRIRAGEYDRAAEALGDPLSDDDMTTATVHRAVAVELRARADWLDIAAIEHLT